MKKRKQHHVWAYYLKPWARDGALWCATRNRIFPSNLDGVANRRDFYVPEALSQEDLLLVRQLGVDPTPGHVQAANMDWLESLQLPFRMKHTQSEMNPDRRSGVEEFEEWYHNFGENLHERIEENFKTHLDSLRRRDTEFYLDDMEAAEFLHSLSIQLTRTVGFRDAIIGAVWRVKGIDARPLAKVLVYLFANNISWVLYAERKQRRLLLIQNETDIPFVTGDQPVVNTLISAAEPGQVLAELEVYYPLGPTLGMLITQPEDHRDGPLFAEGSMVQALNRCIHQSSREQIYADRRSILEDMTGSS